MRSNWKRWALFLCSVVFLFLLPEKAAYAQNSPGSDPSKEIIVVFKSKPTVSLLSTLSANTTQNLEIKGGIPASNAMVFSVTSGDVNTAMTEVRKDTNVQAVFPNYPLNLQSTTNDPKADSSWQWNLYKLNVAGSSNSAWNVTQGSANVVVAVIDTGVQSDHQDLAGKIDSMADCSTGTCTAVTSMTDAHPAGHGTHVAGIVGAATNNGVGVAGVGYNTKLMIIKVSSSGSGGAVVTSTDNFFAGIKWAADHGAKVINTSFGVVADSLTDAAIAEYNNTVAYAWNRGAVIVASAGNCGGNTNGYDACAIHPNGDPNTIAGYAHNSKLYPAASPNVISVSATTTDNSLASYSEHNDSSNANIGNWIDVAAPGGDGQCADSTKTCILSTVPTNQYFWDSGTSMSSPAVAGVAALVLAVKPSLTNEQVKGIIEQSANHSVSAGSNNGLVDALAAVNLANGTAAPSPTPTGSAATVSPTPTGSNNPTPTVAVGSLTPTLTAVPTTPTVIPTAGPTATPTITPYPTTGTVKLPKQPPNPYPSAPYCSQTVSGVNANNPFSSLGSLFVKPVYAQNPWEPCCERTTAGCRTYDPNTGWKGVCSTFQFNCYPNNTPPQTQTWSTCSASCGGGTQTCTQSNGCGLNTSCGTRSCNTQACVPPTITSVPPTAGPTVTPGGPTITSTPNGPVGSCALKSKGDANCDGAINAADFQLWLQEFDTMQPASPPNQNANFACVEGNTQTYFVDLTSFEIWRRNTTSGLNTPAPTAVPGNSTSPSIVQATLYFDPAQVTFAANGSKSIKLMVNFNGGSATQKLDYLRTQINFSRDFLQIPAGQYIDTTASGLKKIFRVDGPTAANQSGKIVIELGVDTPGNGPPTDKPLTIATITFQGVSATSGQNITVGDTEVVDNQSRDLTVITQQIVYIVDSQ